MENCFNQRFGISQSNIKADVFPDTGRNGLMFILEELVKNGVIKNSSKENEGWAVIYREILRTKKAPYEAIESSWITVDDVNKNIKDLSWNNVYTFCERVYKNLISDNSFYDSHSEEWVVIEEMKEAQEKFEKEVNTLLSEENLPYVFVEGEFLRPGKAQTQKNINRAASILSRQELKKVKEHYNKAIEFFSNPSITDYQNSVKESLISLEMAAEVLSGEKVSRDFSKEMTKLSGIEDTKIPAPIIGSMIKIFAYRGTADGVAHGVSEGLRVSSQEAELVLSIVAAYITYLAQFFDSQKEEIPF